MRRDHPEMISRTGHDWIRLGGGAGALLAKVVTRDEFRAETLDFLIEQRPARGPQRRGQGAPATRSRASEQEKTLEDSVKTFEEHEAGQW